MKTRMHSFVKTLQHLQLNVETELKFQQQQLQSAHNVNATQCSAMDGATIQTHS